MKISQINNYKINFGYDKKLNEELTQALSTHPDKKWAQTISSMNNHCNELETNIRGAEKDKSGRDAHFEDYVDIFVSAKQALASIVETTFEHLKFTDREITHYQDEFIKRKDTESDDWRLEVCEALAPLISPNQKTKFNNTAAQTNITTEKTEASDPPKPVRKKITPTSHLEEFIPTSTTPKGFQDVMGMTTLKQDLKEGIIQYITNPEQAQQDLEDYGKEIPKAVLLYGPPGCGKTYITQALAQEGNFPLYMLSIGKAGSHYMNLTSKNIKEAFDEAMKISEETKTPCLLFLDEVDSIGFNRSENMEPDDLKVVATLLQCLDKAKDSEVVVIGATNKYDILDPAVRRRYTTKYFVDVPDQDARIALLQKTLTPMKKAKNFLSAPKDIETVATLLNGFTNDSICKITKQAAINAMRRERADISICDFETAIKETSEEKPDRKAYMSIEHNKQNSRIGF